MFSSVTYLLSLLNTEPVCHCDCPIDEWTQSSPWRTHRQMTPPPTWGDDKLVKQEKDTLAEPKKETWTTSKEEEDTLTTPTWNLESYKSKSAKVSYSKSGANNMFSKATVSCFCVMQYDNMMLNHSCIVSYLNVVYMPFRNLPKVVSWVTIVSVHVQMICRQLISGNHNPNLNLNPGNHQSHLNHLVQVVEYIMCQKIKGRQGIRIK